MVKTDLDLKRATDRINFGFVYERGFGHVPAPSTEEKTAIGKGRKVLELEVFEPSFESEVDKRILEHKREWFEKSVQFASKPEVLGSWECPTCHKTNAIPEEKLRTLLEQATEASPTVLKKISTEEVFGKTARLGEPDKFTEWKKPVELAIWGIEVPFGEIACERCGELSNLWAILTWSPQYQFNEKQILEREIQPHYEVKATGFFHGELEIISEPERATTEDLVRVVKKYRQREKTFTQRERQRLEIALKELEIRNALNSTETEQKPEKKSLFIRLLRK